MVKLGRPLRIPLSRRVRDREYCTEQLGVRRSSFAPESVNIEFQSGSRFAEPINDVE